MVGKLSRDQMQDLLKRNYLGRIGCSDGQRVYVVPVNYFFDGRSIICHSMEGMKTNIMTKNPTVCFEVDEVHQPSVWSSVIIFGQYEEITDEDEKFEAIRGYVNHMMHMNVTERPVLPGGAKRLNDPPLSTVRTVVYRIFIGEMTGRFERHRLDQRYDD